METINNNINSNDDDIVAIIDGVVYQKRPKGKPRNPLRWTKDGKHITGYIDREKRLEYNKKYKALKVCEFCGQERQISHFKQHQQSKQCLLMKEINETKKKLEEITNRA
jgi:hypothetical protein